jgi:hypothetical protein
MFTGNVIDLRVTVVRMSARANKQHNQSVEARTRPTSEEVKELSVREGGR